MYMCGFYGLARMNLDQRHVLGSCVVEIQSPTHDALPAIGVGGHQGQLVL